MPSLPNRPPSPNRQRVATLALTAFGLAYPFAVYAGLGRIPPVAFVVLALAVLSLRLAWSRGTAAAMPLAPPLVVAAAMQTGLLAVDGGLAAKAYPILMSLAFSVLFALSLLRPPSLVERIAAVTEPDPSPPARAYMRRVTLAWSLVLAANAAISAWTALKADLSLWTFYNGFLSYVVMGMVFAVEYAIRRRVRRAHGAHP